MCQNNSLTLRNKSDRNINHFFVSMEFICRMGCFENGIPLEWSLFFYFFHFKITLCLCTYLNEDLYGGVGVVLVLFTIKLTLLVLMISSMYVSQ